MSILEHYFSSVKGREMYVFCHHLMVFSYLLENCRILFLIMVAIPFRRRARWAWWACWVPMLANLTYTFTLAHYNTTTLRYSLIADVALPVLLLLHIPAFFGNSRRTR